MPLSFELERAVFDAVLSDTFSCAAPLAASLDVSNVPKHGVFERTITLFGC